MFRHKLVSQHVLLDSDVGLVKELPFEILHGLT